MPNYRRFRVCGGTYFFTLVTHERCPFLTTPLARNHLRSAIETIRTREPFLLNAIVLLPDHLHAIWTLPNGDDRFSIRWKRIKELFTRTYLADGGWEGPSTVGRENHGERAVWQQRFWEHSIRDEGDLKRCVDYVHWNPVKHGLVQRVSDYEWSTFHQYVRLGEYEPVWCCGEIEPIVAGAEWE